MDTSFYTAALGAGNQQKRLDVIANNMANINTTGYKTKSAIFSDLMYYNLNDAGNVLTKLQAGTGIRVSQVNTDFTPQTFQSTGRTDDFAIEGKGFFMLSNPVTREITYTRDGSFQISQRGNEFYLATADGKLVLDQNRQPITVDISIPAEQRPVPHIGIYEFTQKNGMESVGKNEFKPIAKNGQPTLSTQSRLRQKSLESSGVDVATEMSRMIESQRAYSMSLKMVQTSDEMTATINTLR